MKRAKLIKSLIFFLAFVLLSCKETPIGPEKKEDISPQIDIPWPSLANSPWPMQHHDPQSTGRSKYAGPQNGVVSKKVHIGISESGISIGYNSTIFVGTDYSPNNFYALDYEGNIKWMKTGIVSRATPLISFNSTIYIGDDNSFYAFSEKGDSLWNYLIKDRTVGVGINIDKEGNLYCIDYNHDLIVLAKDGKLKWTIHDERILQWVDAAPTFSPDGKILYVQGIDVSVLAIDINTQTVKWTFGDKEQLSSPVIDNNGNIFIISGKQKFSDNRVFYSINSNGNVNWKFNFSAHRVGDNTEPTIDYNGNIYFGADTLYSLSNSGKLRWKINLSSIIISPLISDKNNVIYVGTRNRTTGNNKIFAVNDSGKILWEILDTEERALGVSPALSEDGILFYPTWDNNNGVYLIIK